MKIIKGQITSFSKDKIVVNNTEINIGFGFKYGSDNRVNLKVGEMGSYKSVKMDDTKKYLVRKKKGAYHLITVLN